jgi:hypothetical protein
MPKHSGRGAHENRNSGVSHRLPIKTTAMLFGIGSPPIV